MSRSSWYRRVRRGSGDVTQGDIIFDCQILKPLFDVTGQMVDGALGVDVKSIKFNGIVMTQACDIAQGNVGSIVMCPVKTVTEIRDEIGWGASRMKNQLDLIRKGQMPAYFLLDKYVYGGNVLMEYAVVDFKNVYSVPIDVLRVFARQNPMRICLKSPYKESLTQAFARFFARVGLPDGVEKSDLDLQIDNIFAS